MVASFDALVTKGAATIYECLSLLRSQARLIWGAAAREGQSDKTAIHAGQGAYITGQNAAVRQNPDGSISFHVGSGPGDSIQFFTRK